jgi:hypothetical protein
MPDKTDIGKWIAAGLLILHIAWIGNHMRWVASSQINPWRLGGYAMYTIPPPAVKLLVYLDGRPDAPIQASLTRYHSVTRFTNNLRTFRCSDVPAGALLAFFEENRDLIGTNLAFVYRERQFVRDPPSIKMGTQGMVRVFWQDIQTFTYTNNFCGNVHTETASLPSELVALP